MDQKVTFSGRIRQNDAISKRLVQARSERGSRRLPRKRSSEISKNYHKNDLQIYMSVEINRAGKFGPFLLRFRALSKMTSKHTLSYRNNF